MTGLMGRLNYPNGYGLSIVFFNGSYGYESGLFEVGYLKDGELIEKENPFYFDMVEGHLTLEQIEKKLQEIKNYEN